MTLKKWRLMLALAALALTASAQATRAAGEISTQMQTPKLPPINGWLLHGDSSYANWLGIKYFGKTLREPINVIIVDPVSTSPEMAVATLMKACKAAGYEEEYGHSSGYCGVINGALYKQIPNDRHMAFSNKDFFQTNNHGRIMGPALFKGSYVFIAAFSTERPTIRHFEHLFVSFCRARDDFGARMDARTPYKNQGYVSLGNVIDDDTMTTADHDGNAILLVAER